MFKRRIQHASLVSILALASLNSRAQDAQTIEDIRCVVIGMKIAGAAAYAQQSRGVFMTLYYIGRLDGRAVKVNVERLIVDEANKMTDANYASDEKRCEAGLTEKGLQITKIGRDLLIGVDKATPGQAH
jgi:hypothetical protein